MKFEQMMHIIYVLLGFTLIIVVLLGISTAGDRYINTSVCEENVGCRNVTVKFHGFGTVDADTLSAYGSQIIKELSK